jgi:hypothetical protein
MSQITLIKSSMPARVCKSYRLENGNLVKDVIANVTSGEGTIVDVHNAEKMMAVLQAVTQRDDIVICPGIWRNAEPGMKFKVMSEAALCDLVNGLPGKVAGGVIMHNGEPVSARLKRGISNSEWILFDADNPAGIPDEWATMNIGRRLELWEPFLPGIMEAERIELRGSSARVVKKGKQPGHATHAWVKITNPELLQQLKAHIRIQMSLHNVSFVFNKHSKDNGSIVAQEPRSVFDLAVFDTGRLVFCAKPDVTDIEDYYVADAGITLVNKGGGAFDNSAFASAPDQTDIDRANAKDGTALRYRVANGFLNAIDSGLLSMDTEITSKGVVKSLRDWTQGMETGAKLRCEAPFRVSESEAAFIRIGENGLPFIHDVGCATTYTLSQKREANVLPDRALSVAKASITTVEGEGSSPEYRDIKITKFGKQILPTRANLQALISWAEMDVRLDVFTRKIVAWRHGRELKDHIDAELIDLAAQTGLPKSAVLDQIDAIAAARPLNKPQAWLEGLSKPDGDPLADWLLENQFVRAEGSLPIHEQWGYIIWKRFFIACCAAADQLEKCTNQDAIRKFEQVLVMVSKQGKKKTTALMQMLPPELREYFKGGIHLNLKNKDSLIEATSCWIAELGELDATFRLTDISALKAFLSRSDDTIRTPYDRRAQILPRRTVYFATVNDDKFLKDITGNRRYLPITLDKRLTYSQEIGKKIFAQAWHRYLEGEQWWLDDSEEQTASIMQDEHDGNNLIPLLQDAFDFSESRRDLAIKPGIILEMLGFKGIAMASNTTRLAAALRQLGIERYGVSRRDNRYYAMPPISLEYFARYKLAIGEKDDG